MATIICSHCNRITNEYIRNTYMCRDCYKIQKKQVKELVSYKPHYSFAAYNNYRTGSSYGLYGATTYYENQ